MNTIPEGRGALRRLAALVLQRCPRCLRGRLFRGLLTMNDPCPTCGQLLQREEGYFLGAMYVSYALGCGVVSVGYFVMQAIWPEMSPIRLCLYLFAGYVPFMPLLFRYSRTIFMHLDYLVSWGESTTGTYVRMRQRDLEEQSTKSKRL